jgi:hypothetical protein
MEMLYFKIQEAIKCIQVESFTETKERLHVATRKTVFIASIQEVVNEHKLGNDVQALGLEANDRQYPNDEELKEKGESLYGEFLQKVAAERKEMTAREAKEKEKKKKQEEELLKSKPEVLMNEFLNRRIHRKCRNRRRG